MKIIFFAGEPRRASRGGISDGGFIEDVDFKHREAVFVDVVETLKAFFAGFVQVLPGGSDDGKGSCPEKMAGESKADTS